MGGGTVSDGARQGRDGADGPGGGPVSGNSPVSGDGAGGPAATAPRGAVLLLSGPPGAGKSTVADLLTGERPGFGVRLHCDDFWACVRQGAVPPYLPEAESQNRTVIGVIAGAAVGYAVGGYRVVVDGVVGPWFVPPFRSAAEEAGVALHYVMLVPDEHTTVRRGTTRTGHPLTDPEPIRLMRRQFASPGEYTGHVLDTTGQQARETADAVFAGLADGRWRLAQED